MPRLADAKHLVIGLVVGIGVGLVLALVSGLAAAQPAMLMVSSGAAIATGVIGYIAGKSSGSKPVPARFTGRVFAFPQGPYYIEIALRRAGFVRREGEG